MDEVKNNQSNNDEQKVVELYSIAPKNRIFLNILITFGVCFIFVVFGFYVVLRQYQIEGDSMQPTINNEYTSFNEKLDTVYVSKTENYQRGDIVIINNTLENDKIIKRVIAIGGDTITFSLIEGTEIKQTIPGQSNKVVVSMEMEISITNSSETLKLKEDYIKETMVFNFITPMNSEYYGKYEEYKKMNNALKENLTYSITLPENTFYCMGDNRNLSKDSRCYGLFDKSDIMGEMVLHIPYGKTIFYAIWHKIFG